MTPTPTWSTTQQTPCSAACGEGLGPNVRRAIFEAATSSSGLSGVLPPHSAALPVSAASPRHFCHCLAAHWSFWMCWLAGHQRGLPSPSRHRQVRAGGVGGHTAVESSRDSSCALLTKDAVTLLLFCPSCPTGAPLECAGPLAGGQWQAAEGDAGLRAQLSELVDRFQQLTQVPAALLPALWLYSVQGQLDSWGQRQWLRVWHNAALMPLPACLPCCSRHHCAACRMLATPPPPSLAAASCWVGPCCPPALPQPPDWHLAAQHCRAQRQPRRQRALALAHRGQQGSSGAAAWRHPPAWECLS